MECCENVCSKCKGIGMLVVGLLIVVNSWLQLVNWWMLVGVLFALKGILMVAKPNGCGCNSVGTSQKTAMKKKK